MGNQSTTATTTAATKKNLMDNLNSGAQISAWTSAITGTVVATSPGAWYQPFEKNLATAQAHANQYLNTIGPNAWDLIPNAIIHYGTTHNNAMGDVQKIMSNVPPAGELTPAQLMEIQELFGALRQDLQKLLGHPKDSNLTVPSPQSVYGVLNDLKAFRTNISNDNQNLSAGQQGAGKEVGLLGSDEKTMNENIKTLTAEIGIWNHDIEDSEIGLGASIFVAMVGLALAPVTGGGSLVVTGVGVVGLGGAIAADVVYSDKVKAALAKIAADQREIDRDKQEVLALQGIIKAFGSLETLNQTAQDAVEGVVDHYTSMVTDVSQVIADLKTADSSQALGILEQLNIQDAISDWNTLVDLAQGIQNSTVNKQTLQQPA